MSQTATFEVQTAAELAQQPKEYQAAVKKIVISHAVNELYGAQVFDEPAIATFRSPPLSLAPASRRTTRSTASGTSSSAPTTKCGRTSAAG